MIKSILLIFGLTVLCLALTLPEDPHPWQYEIEPNDVYPTQLIPFAHARMAGTIDYDGDIDRYFMWLGFEFPWVSHWGGFLYFRKEEGRFLQADLDQGFPPPDSTRLHWSHAEEMGTQMWMEVEFIHVPWFPLDLIMLEVSGEPQEYSIWGPYYQYGPPGPETQPPPPEHIPGMPVYGIRMDLPPEVEPKVLPPF